MAIYAIGDIQGCYEELQALLALIEFDRQEDQLWFTGDLVNRGPDSLQVLRFVKDLGAAAQVVLGNHDLHLLAVAEGFVTKHKGDTLQAILAAEDKEELLHWLRQRPLMHQAPELGYCLIHAGLPPQWNIDQAQACAAEVEAILRSEDYRDFLAHMYGNEPDYWDESHAGWDRLRFITNCFTRLRYCDAQGHLYLQAKGAPGSQPENAMPWYEHPQRASTALKIIFGHWSTLGLYRGHGVVALDTGCLWGGLLTAYRLDDGEVFCCECQGYQAIS
jgi:bis(5'-nucleosyl)-tetraphosphatase (symmetrical)